MAERFAIVIVGAGPAGLSAAARAAELGVSHVVLEASPWIAATVRGYQKGKLVMTEPATLPLRSALSFHAGSRETVLETWGRELAGYGVNLRTGARVSAIEGRKGAFFIRLDGGEWLESEHVVVAIGIQGNIRRLDVPGGDGPGVQYHLDDPMAFVNETIVVVGGGDSGIENALALAQHNRVVMVNRQEEFSNCREVNADALRKAVRAGRLTIRSGTSLLRIDARDDGGPPLRISLGAGGGSECIDCHRVVARLGAAPPRRLLEDFGIVFPNEDANSTPQVSDAYESNVPGLHVIGAVAGYPLIKQALNQGYEVIEHILGNAVEPADEGFLARKFAGVPGIESVADGIRLMRQTQPLLNALTTLQLREFMFDSDILLPTVGEIVVRRNDYSNSFLSILRGTVQVLVENALGVTSTITLKCGDFFGEIGLLSGRRRSGTVVAGENCVLIETPRRSMLRLMDQVPAIQRKLDEVALKRVVQNCFGGALEEEQVENLVCGATSRKFLPGEVIFREGDPPDALYLIRRGSITVSRKLRGREVVSAYVAAGNYIGEMALLSKTPRTATIRTASPTELVVLDADRFIDLLGRNSEVLRRVSSEYLERVRSYESAARQDNGELVHFLIDQGLGEATDVLLIDYARCVRCDNCVDACADAHDGTSRLDRGAGRTFAAIHIPASCRHCEHPHCMKDCPPDAIHRTLSGETFIGETCIGCGKCQANCAYGVIRMAGASANSRPGLLRRLFGERSPAGRLEPAQPGCAQRAVKCDMCLGLLGGPACVRACPTGAAFRVGPEEFLDIIRT